ncbi:EmrA/EmrK family multidrug efflux transporter periplasmic adaptor subunit [Sulfuriferula sp. AH1]|uniref:HlyD family efflux transporter periplasmic adaptor subunit n=1 Tax=Sulfuriferula sp. AH1 TaxID=1985873 RepID=UPI000B3B322E|nr:HlyD family efflux transporter periplasmic adaptor subunit [Sulfuriferula sp. AH1]ARU30495.1 EmrA/EmrK family multidrug efflux transporter periplasmic adaptor subunit [Sulfuriferula sp. AH1]
MSEQKSPQSGASAPATNSVARKKWMLVLTMLILAAAVAYAIHWYVHDRNFEYSDDAYVAADIVQLTPQVAGTVVAIAVNETDSVRAGEVLVRLDDTNAQVALREAEAQLAQTVREVRTTYAANNSLTATIAQHRAELEQARADMANAQADLARRQRLAGTGAVSQEELQHAQTAVEAAHSRVAADTAAMTNAREQLQTNQALTGGTSVRNHPKVLAAAVKVQQAYLDLQRVSILAPVDGYIGKRSVQLGQRVAIGAPLMTIVPLNQVWVDANYKEAQLRRIRIGQPVALTADVYGDKVEYHGRVAGIGSGTGAAFALLPAQNATGNWIKVVQRVPVRIALDAKEVVVHPLRVGMSMEASVDLSRQGGPVLANPASRGIASQTGVYAGNNRAVDVLIDKIISANLGEHPQKVVKL